MNQFRVMVLAVASSALLAQEIQPVGEPHVYKTVGGRDLKLYVMRPDGRGPFPAAVFFHGGGWTGGRPTQFNAHGAHLVKRGMVVVQAEYRLLEKGKKEPPTVCIQDAKSAMRWVRAHAKELRVRPDRIASGGGSAGGHLAAFVGMMDGIDDPGDDLKVTARSNAMLLFNPVFDNGPNGYGFERTGERFRDYSPFHNISAKAAPAIVFVGSMDKLLPVPTVEMFCDGLRKAAVRCEWKSYEGQPHGFFNYRPGKSNPYYDQTLQETDAFLTSLGWIAAQSK